MKDRMVPCWQIFVDTGGTFTDCIGVSPSGASARTKVLSNGSLRARVSKKENSAHTVLLQTQWELPEDFFVGFQLSLAGESSSVRVTASVFVGSELRLALEQPYCLAAGDLVELSSEEEPPILGARILTKTPREQPLPPLDLRLATTRGTNALLERKGAKTLFLVTEGFADLLEIGNQQRPDLFALEILKTKPFYYEVAEVAERLDAKGQVLRPIEKAEAAVRAALAQAKAKGCTTVACSLLHSDLNPEHEQQVARWAEEVGFEDVVLSSEVSSFIKILPRAQTAVIDAYLGPIMNTYLERVEAALGDGYFSVMTSAGGLVAKQSYRPKDSLLSGPAGGIVGASSIGQQCGFEQVIAFDMGGTSTDVTRYKGDFEYQATHTVGGAEIVAPSLRIETVAAGGGSICGYNGHTLFVGPESAGALPGPACYGAGGPLTVTDVNLLLGRLKPASFGIPVSPEASWQKLDELVAETGQSRETLLMSFFNIANERMADAIQKISVREGYDPATYALVAFGGAGGMHACAIAEQLGMQSVLFPADAGLLSAYGLQQAVLERFAQKQLLTLYRSEEEAVYREILATLEQEVLAHLAEAGVSPERSEIRQRNVSLRLKGQESALTIAWVEGGTLAAAFARQYQNVFGYFPKNAEIEIVALQVIGSEQPAAREAEVFEKEKEDFVAEKQIRCFVADEWVSVPWVERDKLSSGSWLKGPALLTDAYSTLFIEPGWELICGSRATLRLDVSTSAATQKKEASVAELELFTHRFLTLVEEMGLQLQRTAYSTNVKERLDFSCALLDPQGRLIANAPHIPVHLGALGVCVRTVVASLPALEPGDVIVTNHPGYGGSHLPDVTVVTPVFEKEALIGYVANRAHHAEIGGKRPGSMPPDANSLAEEGVVIAPTYLFRRGESCWGELEAMLAAGQWPSRSIQDNMADLRAQVAANRRGAERLLALVADYSFATVRAYMEQLYQYAASAMAQVVSQLGVGPWQAVERLDDGSDIVLRAHCKEGRLCIDFSGTALSHPGNLNATPAIVQSAVIYFLRLWVTEAIPLNEGLMDSVDLVLPECFLNPDFSKSPEESPAVVGGNVETSQRIVDTLVAAFELMAGSQGTMNNLVFGNADCSYYETICGGAGAGEGFVGASAVHTHMTNTAITDPEILERRYPVRLERFAIRKGSGGAGQYSGGEGIVRELSFLKALSLSLLTQHRKVGPHGLAGGESGEPGQQCLISAGGTQSLESVVHLEVKPGDKLVLKTPGGGGWGQV